MTRTGSPRAAAWSATAAESSRDESSTTITSKSRYVWAVKLVSRSSSRVARSRTGTITDTLGSLTASKLQSPANVNENGARDLSPPVVPADLYTEDYYTGCCAGHEEWVRSGGEQAAGVYAHCLDLAGLEPGEVVLDIGTGRGELLAIAVERGASRAVGVEYAKPAVALARQTLTRRDAADRADVVLADARRLPMRDASVDVVTLLDVVEHLAPSELAATLAEGQRVLRRGGRVVVHTMPNREIYEITYRWLRRLWPGGRRWPADPRNDMERLMHVNEQTQHSLRAALRSAGFRDVDVAFGHWIYTPFVPSERARRVFAGFARFGPTKRFGVGNLLATATR
jgi:cyclopropane fatty-acyl-phospholipid synthase-like methyltransferase